MVNKVPLAIHAHSVRKPSSYMSKIVLFILARAVCEVICGNFLPASTWLGLKCMAVLDRNVSVHLRTKK